MVQSVWQLVWKRDIKADDSWSGEGRGWRVGLGGPMLKASFGSPCCFLGGRCVLVVGLWGRGGVLSNLLARGVEGFALHGYPAPVYASSFGGVDCIGGFLVLGGGEEGFGLGRRC